MHFILQCGFLPLEVPETLCVPLFWSMKDTSAEVFIFAIPFHRLRPFFQSKRTHYYNIIIADGFVFLKGNFVNNSYLRISNSRQHCFCGDFSPKSACKVEYSSLERKTFLNSPKRRHGLSAGYLLVSVIHLDDVAVYQHFLVYAPKLRVPSCFILWQIKFSFCSFRQISFYNGRFFAK